MEGFVKGAFLALTNLISDPTNVRNSPAHVILTEPFEEIIPGATYLYNCVDSKESWWIVLLSVFK
jgi:hypothetical protein